MENDSISVQKDCYTVWENCLKVIRTHIAEQTYTTWFDPIKPLKLVDKVLTIQVPSRFFYEWLEEHYVHLLRKAIDASLGTEGRLEYTIIMEKQEKPYLPNHNSPQFTQSNNNNTNNTTPQNNTPASPSKYKNKSVNSSPNTPKRTSQFNQSFQINPRYTFESFIEGDCNRLARSAGLAVAQKPGVTSFNPLMLYGGVGLGKTHLVQAIGNYVQENGQKKILYVSSDRFTNQFIEALKNNDLQSFTDYYMQADVLAIDDVQFLSGKEKTQEIFFNIFNHLHQSGKQIIMTSDCPPKELKGLQERLLSRFKWGLTADLKQPDLETRIAIIHKILQSEDNKDIEISSKVVEYLAHSIDSNVRELEGAIVSLIAKASLNQSQITMELAKQTVQQIVQPVDSSEINIDEVQKYVGDYFGVSVEMLKAKSRKKEIVIARQIAMYFAKEYTGFSLKSIGYHFGGRDHSTVIHAIQTVNDMMSEKKELKMYIDDLRKKFSK